MNIKTVIKLGFGISVMLVLLLSAGLDELASNIWSLNMTVFALAVLIIVPLVAAGTTRWWLVVKSADVPASFTYACRTYLIGAFFSFVTPSKVGSLVKFYYLKKHYNTPSSTAFSLAFMDKVFDMFVVLAVASLGVYTFSGISIWLQAALVAILAILVFMVLAFSSRRIFLAVVMPILSRLKILSRVFKKGRLDALKTANQLYEPFHCLKSRPSYLAFISFFSLVYWIIYGLQLMLLAAALGINLNPITAILVVCTGTAVGLIPVTIDGIGTREATLVYLLSLSGVAMETGLIIAIILFVITHITSLAGGIAYMTDKKTKIE